MKKALTFHYITLFIFCQAFLSLLGLFVGFDWGNQAFALDTENFYFEDFSADYYLSRAENGVSKLKVEENFTIIFPDYNQNKGICREIPFKNLDGKNTVLKSLSRSDITLRRNGFSEPIYSIEKFGDYYEVCTGDDDYVTGRQVYTFIYNFEKVISDFSDYQELYWDTNGNGWKQKFEKVTARVHLVDTATKNAFDGQKWCYVGTYGEKGEDRCEITMLEDGVEFSASNLKRYENLTFDLQFKPNSFAIPEAEKSYILVGIMVVMAICCGLLLLVPLTKFLKTSPKRRFYNGLFVKPEYQPPTDCSLAEAAEVFLGTKKDVKAALLLDMVIKKRIELIKRESKIFGSEKWAVRVLNLENARIEELIILAILNNGTEVETGEVIELRSHATDSALLRLGRKFDSTVLADLKRDQLVESKYKIGRNNLDTAGKIIRLLSIIGFFFILIISAIPEGTEELADVFNAEADVIFVGSEAFIPVFLLTIVLTIAIWTVLSRQTQKYASHTMKGLETARYLDGLKLYIGMAEKERLRFLQSVSGADTSPEGVVKLYEKLLPYAAIFGLEKSWMNELAKYYEINLATQPDWYRSGLSPVDMITLTHLAANYATRSTTPASSGGSISGGGGSSSSSSGGGGGGFSGGGGGGGGGHGR